MRISRFTLIVVASLFVIASAWADSNGRGRNSGKASLSGYEEVPAISSTGSGEFRLRIVDNNAIEFELTYENLEGATTTASHVHLGQKSVNGGVIFFICGGGGRPACTPTNGSFSGTVVATDIIGPAAQGIDPAESDRFEEVVRAIRAGATYINVHTDKHPGGEIRGQIRGEGNDD
jgi:hypothetical protein